MSHGERKGRLNVVKFLELVKILLLFAVLMSSLSSSKTKIFLKILWLIIIIQYLPNHT